MHCVSPRFFPVTPPAVRFKAMFNSLDVEPTTLRWSGIS